MAYSLHCRVEIFIEKVLSRGEAALSYEWRHTAQIVSYSKSVLIRFHSLELQQGDYNQKVKLKLNLSSHDF